MLFFTDCVCRNAKSSRRTLREKSPSAVGDECKRQSTTELCGTKGFDSSGSFSIVLNYGPHSPTDFLQVLTSSSLPKTTSMVREITFSQFKKLYVYHCPQHFLAAKGWKDVFSNELLHWFIQKSRFLLLRHLLLVNIKFVPGMLVHIVTTRWFHWEEQDWHIKTDKFVFYDNKLSNCPLSLVDALHKL